jgi:hypothetical protein
VWVRDPLVPGGGGSGAGAAAAAAAAAASGSAASSDAAGAWEMRLTMVEQLPEHYPFSDE